VKVSDYIAKFLEQNQVKQVFELTGGMITHLLDSLHRHTNIRIVSMRHEQAAAFAAEGSARMTGIPGVALATSGPGAINLLTGVGSCFFDSVPAVFITGQVNRNEMSVNKQVRQLGFQETDIVEMAKPITKGAWLVLESEQIPKLLRQAFDLALSGRPGPVLIDIPMDVQRADIPDSVIAPAVASQHEAIDQAVIKKLMEQFEQAARPLILGGGGIRAARATKLFRSLVDHLQIPVVHSLMGVDLLPYDHPMRVGMIGTYGNRWANHALHQADHLLVLGSRLDVRQTGGNTDVFREGKQIWHVDVDPDEINNRVTGCNGIVSDLKPFLQIARAEASPHPSSHFKTWRLEIEKLRQKWPDTEEQPHLSGINPNIFMHRLSRKFPQATAFISDVGQHQMWAAQSVELTDGQRFLTAGGMGSMGFALPSAIGVAVSYPKRPVVVIAGDGGFQCNIQELQTVIHDSLPIKIAIINNKSLGMVRQFQESYFESRFQSTVWGYSAPGFARIAVAYGIPGHRVEFADELDAALDWFCGISDGPALLEVCIDQQANAYPKTAFGKPINEMEPFKNI
jgi:acetolactate synthase-1/2/3 large subunit